MARPDVWFAHLVHLEANEIALLAETGTGCSHCPVSNARLGSGIAPAPRMAAAGVPVSLGVDGVASNESGSMTHEANFAGSCIVRRTVRRPPPPRGAALGRKAARACSAERGRHAGAGPADLVLYDVSGPRFNGFHDYAIAPVAAGGPAPVSTTS